MNIINGFINSSKRFPKRNALVVDSKEITYEDLCKMATKIASVIKSDRDFSGEFVSFLSHRSLLTYSSVLGIMLSGNAYVPLNPKFPNRRLKSILDISGAKIVIVDDKYIEKFNELLPLLDKPYTFIFQNGKNSFKSNYHKVVYIDDGEHYDPEPFDLPNSFPAYLLFTSGSTGTPKGIMINHENLTSYVNYMSNRMSVIDSDRFSQLSDMTFDPSVHDMFVCWSNGASLYSVPEASSKVPTRFFIDNKITTCFIVPSIAVFMNKMRSLGSNMLPNLRYCVFCGEALSAETARQWQSAAPNSVVENLYGPTEATVAITNYKWTDKSFEECDNGIVPIGWMFNGQKSCVINENLQVVQNKDGELCISGSQVTTSYFNDPEKTASQYIRIDKDVWYRTGDLVRIDQRGCMHYIGRIDNQVKIMGYRVELQEIDCIIKKIVGCDMVVSVCRSGEGSAGNSIVSFICCEKPITEREILSLCKSNLPDYMVPRKIYFVDEIPLNNNGKIDGVRLKQMAKEYEN
jgi:amino acid adenylation domain-containing protein